MCEGSEKNIVIDLYAGAGGLSLGAMRAGFSLVAAIEFDTNAMNTHKMNFPNVQHLEADITKLSGAEILEIINLKNSLIAGVIGGPPCQGFSSIGHGNVDDKRNHLFVKFFELVAELNPLFFVAENVPGILNPKYSGIREEAFKNVSEYHLLDPIRINASEYGAPTTRTRIFFIGYRDDPRISAITVSDIESMKVPESSRTNVYMALEGLPERICYSMNKKGYRTLNPDYCDPQCKHSQSEFFYSRVFNLRPIYVGDTEYLAKFDSEHMVNGCIPTKHSSEVKKRFSKLQYGQRDIISKASRLDPAKYCPTLRAGTGPDKGSFQAVRPIHYKCSRVITPREAARLQGFPDWYKLPETIWHGFRQIGNSVSPIVAEAVLTAISSKLSN